MYSTLISKKLNIYIPSQNLTALTTINAVLGQNGLNVFEFTKQFNNSTKKYLADIVLRIEVFVHLDKKFEIVVKRPNVIFMVYEEIFKQEKGVLADFDFINNKDSLSIKLSDLYRICFFIKKISDINKNIKSIFKTVLGTLSSAHINIVKDI
jgi:ribosomal protein L11